MLSPLLLLAVVVQVGVTGRPGYVPRQVMREARDAIDGDSLDRVRARWQARLEPDSTDREAMLGLATAARLGADDSTAAPPRRGWWRGTRRAPRYGSAGGRARTTCVARRSRASG